MRLTVEWLLIMAGGILGGGIPLVFGYCIGAVVSMNSSALVDPIATLIMLATLILSPLGAMAGGNIAGWFIDRYNGYDEHNDN